MKPGEAWGVPSVGPPDLVVAGGDDALAAAVAAHPGALVRFVADATSQLALAVGIAAGGSGHTEPAPHWAVPMDVLRLDDGRIAVNMAVFGPSPEHITWRTRSIDLGDDSGTVLSAVVAIGQFHHGLDLVPRGHPGDGYAELQRYRLGGRQRGAMRQRLRTGTHLPHPGIEQRRVRSFVVAGPRDVPLELDGHPAGTVRTLRVDVVAAAYRLLL